MSNLLLPSSRERQTCQSKSSGSRRLNRGNCCTPKFALPFLSTFSHHNTLGVQDPVRFFLCLRLLLALLTQIRVCVCTKVFWPKMPKMTFMFHVGLPSLSIPSFKFWFQVLPSQLDSWPKKSAVLGKKSIVANSQSNLMKFGPHQHYELIWTIWSSLDHNSIRNLIRSPKGQNGHF